jgi:fucose 4-O-acetylase-like acetyltransferase
VSKAHSEEGTISARVPYPDALRGIGILFVVAIHAFGYLRLPIEGSWRVLWLVVSLNGVSMFFVADGWLYATRHRMPIVPRMAMISLRTSLQRLGAPWALFSCIYLGIGLLAQRMHLSGGPALLPNGISDLPAALWRGTAATQLYFLPALLFVRAATFVLQPIIRGKPFIAGFLAATVLASWKLAFEAMLPHPSQGTEPLLAAGFGLGFAALGWSIAEAEIAGVRNVLWLIAAVLLGGVVMFITGALAMMLAQCACLLGAWWLARGFAWARLHRWVAVLGRHTMEIYLLHMPILISLISTVLLFLRVPDPAALVIDVGVTVACSLALGGLIRVTLPVRLASALGITDTHHGPSPSERGSQRGYRKAAQARGIKNRL